MALYVDLRHNMNCLGQASHDLPIVIHCIAMNKALIFRLINSEAIHSNLNI